MCCSASYYKVDVLLTSHHNTIWFGIYYIKQQTEMYGGYFDEQIAKQARTAISKAISAGKKNMEVQFPPVPNVEEAKFGTPLK